MADHNSDHTNTVVRDRVERNDVRSGSNASLAFILGGVVVAILVLAWIFTGGDFGMSGDGAANDGDTNISIEAPAASDSAPADSAPAPADTAPAPTDTAPAPADNN
jgi:hypothetical protein